MNATPILIALFTLIGGCTLNHAQLHDAGSHHHVTDAGHPGDGDGDAPAGPDGGQDLGHGPPCFDRGRYNFDGFIHVQGLKQTCNGQDSCIDGQCVPTPHCSADHDRECLFTPASEHGDVALLQVVGEYVYWVELGTFDVVNKYRADGAVARARIGEWQREELLTHLTFATASGKLFDPTPNVGSTPGWFVFKQRTSSVITTAIATDGRGPYELKSGAFRVCISEDGEAYWVGAQHTLFRQDLATASYVQDDSLLIVDGSRCAVATDKHLWLDDNVAVRRLVRGAEHAGVYIKPDYRFLDVGGDILLGSKETPGPHQTINRYVATVSLTDVVEDDNLANVQWVERAQIFHHLAPARIHGNHFYWARSGYPRFGCVVLRQSFQSIPSTAPEVLAEINDDPLRCNTYGWALFVTDKALLWRLAYRPTSLATIEPPGLPTLHYLPGKFD